MTEENETIETTDYTLSHEILNQLQGWVLTEEASTLSDMDYDNKVSNSEVLSFYDVAKEYAHAYTLTSEDEELNHTALVLWSAGLLWNKYNVRTNNQLDETNILGYGDKLIIQAKEMFKSSKSYNFYAY